MFLIDEYDTQKGSRMSKSEKYRIKQKDFRKLEKLTERIYS